MTDPNIHIRPVEPADADQWLALRIALWPDEDPHLMAEDVKSFFGHADQRSETSLEAVLVAMDRRAGRLVGFAELSRRAYAEGCETSPVGFLEGWYVAAEYRQQGVGGALVASAEAWARSLGCQEFASDAVAENTLSAVAHKALGFEDVGLIRCFRKSL